MDPADQARLDYNRKTISENTKPKPIALSLVQEGIFKGGDYDAVVEAGSEVDQTNKLLDILVNRGPNAYAAFKKLISEEYGWIVKQLDQTPLKELEKRRSEDEESMKNPASLIYHNRRRDSAQATSSNVGHQGNIEVNAVTGSGNILNFYAPPSAAAAAPLPPTASNPPAALPIVVYLNSKIHSSHFKKIADQLNKVKWICVGRTLMPEKDDELKVIKKNYQEESFGQCAYEMLMLWSNSDPDGCTYKNLFAALKENDLNKTVVELKEEFKIVN